MVLFLFITHLIPLAFCLTGITVAQVVQIESTRITRDTLLCGATRGLSTSNASDDWRVLTGHVE